MASLSDIANSILNDLNAIQTNTGNTDNDVLQVKADTGALNLKLAHLISVNESGFFNLSQGLYAIVGQQFITNQQLQFEILQNETIICWLQTIANLLCDIKRILEASKEDADQILELLSRLEQILELVHGAEAIEVHAREELEERIEKCCPPEHPEPPPCFEPCEGPKRPPEVQKPDYRPLPEPDRPRAPNPQ